MSDCLHQLFNIGLYHLQFAGLLDWGVKRFLKSSGSSNKQWKVVSISNNEVVLLLLISAVLTPNKGLDMRL